MKLSIISDDSTVCVDGVCVVPLSWEGTPNDVHALQWKDVNGWIEYNDGKPNEDIFELPQWANNAAAAWGEATSPKPKTPNTAETNKIMARSKLEMTDWTTIPDVGNPQVSNPYLANQAEFVAYRNLIRQYAINPIAGDIDWAVEPETQWASV